MPHFDSDYEAKLYADRVAKLDRIAELGAQLGLTRAEALYPNTFRFTHTIPELIALGASKSAEDLEATPIEAAIAGRVMSHRAQGKAGFAHLQQSGERLQIYVRKDDVGATPEQSETLFALYKLLDLGDHIGVRGALMRTRTGELTLKVHPIGSLAQTEMWGAPSVTASPSRVGSANVSPLANSTLADQAGQPALQFLGKSMLALPDKYHGLEDVELRYRQRYVDLIMNSGTLTKAEVPVAANPATSANPSTDVILSGAKDPRISLDAPTSTEDNRGPHHAETYDVERTTPNAVPGTSPVTDAAAPNNEHLDAPATSARSSSSAPPSCAPSASSSIRAATSKSKPP